MIYIIVASLLFLAQFLSLEHIMVALSEPSRVQMAVGFVAVAVSDYVTGP